MLPVTTDLPVTVNAHAVLDMPYAVKVPWAPTLHQDAVGSYVQPHQCRQADRQKHTRQRQRARDRERERERDNRRADRYTYRTDRPIDRQTHTQTKRKHTAR